ncbi:MAG: phage head-tail connector protein [Ruminiclostridium sp.]|nr:phage head-tail connector protein [Ruminiclostridium sp.]
MEYVAEELFLLRLPEGTDLDEHKVGALLLRAENTILDIIGRKRLPEQLIDVQVELALVYYNRLGTEGEKKHSEGELNLEYIDGIPSDIEKRLRNYPRKAGALRGYDTEQT